MVGSRCSLPSSLLARRDRGTRPLRRFLSQPCHLLTFAKSGWRGNRYRCVFEDTPSRCALVFRCRNSSGSLSLFTISSQANRSQHRAILPFHLQDFFWPVLDLRRFCFYAYHPISIYRISCASSGVWIKRRLDCKAEIDATTLL